MLIKSPLYTFWKRSVSTGLKRRRFRRMLQTVNLPADRPLRVLEVGCADGRDTIQFLRELPDCEIHGVDVKPQTLPEDVTFHLADAADLPFEDGEFDLVVSIGLLEHIEPMEKLSAVIREMRRVGRACVAVIPSVSTLLEPHALRLRWPLRLHKKLIHKHSADQLLHLNYFTDHTWTKFEGFADAELQRFFYLFPFVRNLLISAGDLRESAEK